MRGFQYSLLVKGVWGKKRKPQVASLPLINFVSEAPDETTLLEAVDKELNRLQAKPGLRWCVQEYPAEPTDRGGIMIKITQWTDVLEGGVQAQIQGGRYVDSGAIGRALQGLLVVDEKATTKP